MKETKDPYRVFWPKSRKQGIEPEILGNLKILEFFDFIRSVSPRRFQQAINGFRSVNFGAPTLITGDLGPKQAEI